MHPTLAPSRLEPAASALGAWTSSPQPAAAASAGALAAALASPLCDLLDALDYGVVLVRPHGQLVLLNKAARPWVREGHVLSLADGFVQARRDADHGPFNRALVESAERGLRRLLLLGQAPHAAVVAVVPLCRSEGGQAGLVALVLTRRQLAEGLTVQGVARLYGLTPAEAQVLQALCEGREPREIARRHGVCMTTVRTQVNKIREKADVASIRDLIRLLALMPPLVPVVS